MTSKIYGDDADELISVYTDMGKAEQMGAGGGGGVGAEETSSSHSHEKAIEHFLHAHSIASANHPGSSSETAKTAEVVANGYLTMAMSSAKPALTPDAVEDALRSSETYFTEAADIFLLEKGINHPDTIRVTEQLAKINIKLKDFEAAKKYAKTVLESKIEVYGDMSDETATSQQTLGTICLSQANFEEAHKLLKKAQHTLTQLLGPNAKRVKDIEKMIVIIEQSPQMRDKLSKEKHLHNRPAFSNNFKVK
ncbi:tetratricopeptide repeat protein 23-like [Symsagittifera roscoffensis]|uniref:tetratricopeptide repeat protein 23-like n=1 Tax=Symsagittifera roscoffensis TaxID=84072 RepID=UPI00307C382D